MKAPLLAVLSIALATSAFAQTENPHTETSAGSIFVLIDEFLEENIRCMSDSFEASNRNPDTIQMVREKESGRLYMKVANCRTTEVIFRPAN